MCPAAKGNPPPSDAPHGRAVSWSSHTSSAGWALPHLPCHPGKVVFAAELCFFARRGQGKFLWGENGKCLCPWKVSGSVWVFLHASGAGPAKYLGTCVTRSDVQQSPAETDTSSLPAPAGSKVFHKVSSGFFFVQATKIIFVLTSACPCISCSKHTLKYSSSCSSQGEISVIQGKRSCTAEYYQVIDVKTRINSMLKSCEKVWEKKQHQL